jgi:hypothetical protein
VAEPKVRQSFLHMPYFEHKKAGSKWVIAENISDNNFASLLSKELYEIFLP